MEDEGIDKRDKIISQSIFQNGSRNTFMQDNNHRPNTNLITNQNKQVLMMRSSDNSTVKSNTLQ